MFLIATSLLENLEQNIKKNFILKINIHTPNIIIPENITKEDSLLLYANLGTLSVFTGVFIFSLFFLFLFVFSSSFAFSFIGSIKRRLSVALCKFRNCQFSRVRKTTKRISQQSNKKKPKFILWSFYFLYFFFTSLAVLFFFPCLFLIFSVLTFFQKGTSTKRNSKEFSCSNV